MPIPCVTPFIGPIFRPGDFGPVEVLWKMEMVSAMSFDESDWLVASLLAGYAAESVFSVTKDTGAGDVEIGTITFAIAGLVGTVAMISSPTTFAITDRLSIKAPAVADSGATDFNATLKGTRS